MIGQGLSGQVWAGAGRTGGIRMMAASAEVDVDYLRRALLELGYGEALPAEAAPLVHHMLADLNQSTRQYNDLLADYDQLAAHFQEQQALLEKKATGRNIMDLTHITGLDSSILGLSGSLDESLMLQTVEQARTQIESLEAEKVRLEEERSRVVSERDALKVDVNKAQLAAQELSQLLQAKHTHLDSLQREVEKLKRRNLSNAAGLQALALLKYAINLLPPQVQPGFAAKVAGADDSVEHTLSLTDEVLQRVKRELEDREEKLQAAQATVESTTRQHRALEEGLASMRGGITQYQNQVAELNARLSQREFESSLQADVRNHFRPSVPH